MAINFPNSPVNNETYTENGVKWKYNSTYAETNSSGSTYIFAAFAETPFKYSRGR